MSTVTLTKTAGIDFWGAIKSGFTNYVTVSGRATLSEWGYWVLFTTLGAIATSIIDAAMFPQMVWQSTLSSVFELLTFLPSLTVSVRRLHDTDRSGWWMLIALTWIGAVVLVYWCCKYGTSGDNRFGPDPWEKINLLPSG
jgi:uncharacterized membrane protein YhaH (DUF805 family)